MKQYDLTYRGYIQGLVGVGSQAVFITDHSEQFATELYRVDLSKEQPSLHSEALPCGATALAHDEKNVWFAGDNGALYQAGLDKGKPKALAGLSFAEHKVLALAVLAQNQLAVLQAHAMSIVDLAKKTVVQTIEAEHAFSSLASSPDGLWLALGDQKGQVQTYQQQEQTWQLSAKAMLHEAEVTALQFEQHELRFYSAGADRKLLSTHAQGELQALDKGKSSNHQGVIQALHLGKERLFTGADDKTLKAWAYAGGQPVTLKEGLSKVLYLATVTYQGRDHLLVAGSDSSLRLVALTNDEKFGELRCVIKDGYQWAGDYLQSSTAKERQRGIELLAQYDDKKALNRLEKQLKREQDKAQRVAIVQVFAQSKHTYALNVLETVLADKQHDTVRMTAFEALVKRAEKGDLHPFKKTLATGFSDTGLAALEGLLPLAKTNQQAQALLVDALDHKATKVRTLALSYLEKVYPKTSAQASLQALNSSHLDVQRAALIRLFQRQLLNDFAVKQALLLAQDHQDDTLRHTAFLVSILSQPELSKALKTREPDLARQLQELEDFDLLQDKPTDTKTKPTKATRQSALSRLEEADYRILLQGMSNQHADICFSAAFALAVLQDQRAFGLLILLSQENDAHIRAGVCRAFVWLEQADSIPQLELMLNDDDALVRDAAFTALTKVHNDALAVAAYGLHSKHQDIHARALKTLLENFDSKPKRGQVSALKSLLNSLASKHEQAQSPALNLLNIALNDPFAAIRQETVKACLNRQLGGDLQQTLGLLQQAHYEDVHQAALKELFAQHAQNPRPNWVEAQIVAQLNDAHQAVRTQALQFILKEKKHFDLKKALNVAVQSRFIDVREAAFRYLKQNQSKENQKLLQQLVNDEVDTLRHQALDALIGKLHYDSLHQALKSDYDDIRVKAACTLARSFEPLPEVYAALTKLLQRAEPEKAEDYKHWKKTSLDALQGLHHLADPRAFDLVASFIHHKEKALAEKAAAALAWVSQASHKEKLVTLQGDERDFVKANATYALALLGQPEANTLFNNHKLMKRHIDELPLLAAQLCLSTPTPSNLQAYLLNNDTRLSALFVLASYELLQHNTPQLLNGALSIANPEVQLFCADLMTRFADQTACWEYLQSWLIQIQHDHHDKKWQVSVASLKTMASILVHGDGRARKYLLDAMSHLDQHQKPEALQLRFDTFIQQFAKQYYAHPVVDKAALDKPETDAWQQRAFGAYLGVVRQSNYAGYWSGQLVNQRLKALRAMVELAKTNPAMHTSVSSCLLTLLNHEQSQVRNFAFEQLKALGMDLELLGNTATTSLQTDIAKQGLELLIEHYPVKQSRSLLADLIQGNNELLAYEAYDLHCEHIGLVETAPLALQAYSESLRIRSVKDIGAEYETSKAARSLLLEACQNDRIPVALSAAAVLSMHQHPQAYDILSELLAENTQAHQQQVIVRLLGELKEPKVAGLLLDYLRNNKRCRVEDRHIFQQINRYRATELFQPLLEFLEQKPSAHRSIIQALIQITGFDQNMPDYDEKCSDQAWRKDYYPFHDELAVQLFKQLITLKYYSPAVHSWQAMGWVKDKSADQALADASRVLAEDDLPYIVQAMAYRVEKREGSAEGLLKLLTHKSQMIQLLAAEALANNGHNQGFSVLLAAIDYQENGDLRQRAVLALGKLADERALDKLLKLAQDDEHFLSDVAIESIGHMGQSESADKILKLIKARLEDAYYYSEAWKNALNGLRWFNSLSSWQTILATLKHSHWDFRRYAAELLRHWDSEASRDALLKALSQDHDDDVVETAYHSLQTLLKPAEDEVSVADLALLQGHHPDAQSHVMEHVQQHASTSQLLALISADFADDAYAEKIPQQMAQTLLMREDLDIADLEQGFGSKRLVVMDVMAKLLMKVATLNDTSQTYLQDSFSYVQAQWEKLTAQLLQGADYVASQEKVACEKVLQTLIWVQVQHAVFSPRLMALLQTEDKNERELQLQLLKALLAQEKVNDQHVITALATLRESGLSEVRTLADQILVQNGQAGTHWQSFLNQPDTLQSFQQDFNQAANQSAYQAQVLPLLIQNEDVNTLQQIAQDTTQSEAIRLGAIEGLARILTDAAHTALATLHKQIKDKDIARGAYKALRRQQRSRAKADQLNAKVGA